MIIKIVGLSAECPSVDLVHRKVHCVDGVRARLLVIQYGMAGSGSGKLHGDSREFDGHFNSACISTYFFVKM
jgi:hypothetical protein